MDTFKQYLDKYLRFRDTEALKRPESNSLFDMAQFAGAQLVFMLEEPYQMYVARGNPWSPWD